MGKQSKSIKLCCKELRKAVAYKNPNIHVVKNNLLTMHIGDIYKTPKDTREAFKRLIQAIYPKNKLSSIPANLSGKIPVVVPIRYCPFCGKQIRRDLLIDWA